MLERQPSAGFVVHDDRTYSVAGKFPTDGGGRNIALGEIGEEMDIYEQPVGDDDQRLHMAIEEHFEIALEAVTLVVGVGKNRDVGTLKKRVLDAAQDGHAEGVGNI